MQLNRPTLFVGERRIVKENQVTDKNEIWENAKEDSV